MRCSALRNTSCFWNLGIGLFFGFRFPFIQIHDTTDNTPEKTTNKHFLSVCTYSITTSQAVANVEWKRQLAVNGTAFRGKERERRYIPSTLGGKKMKNVLLTCVVSVFCSIFGRCMCCGCLWECVKTDNEICCFFLRLMKKKTFLFEISFIKMKIKMDGFHSALTLLLDSRTIWRCLSCFV